MKNKRKTLLNFFNFQFKNSGISEKYQKMSVLWKNQILSENMQKLKKTWTFLDQIFTNNVRNPIRIRKYNNSILVEFLICHFGSSSQTTPVKTRKVHPKPCAQERIVNSRKSGNLDNQGNLDIQKIQNFQ